MLTCSSVLPMARKRRGEVPAPPHGGAHAQQRGRAHLHDGPGDRHLAHREQVAQREVQAHAEHQEHHADFGELRRQARVGHEARRERTDHDASQQIAHQRRQMQPCRGKAQDERQSEARRDGGDEREVVFHVRITLHDVM
jgi:hypothetical protein